MWVSVSESIPKMVGLCRVPERIRTTLLVVACLLVSACSAVSYLGQAARGQWDLWWRAQPVAELVTDPAVDPERRDRLQTALAIRAFASAELGLPDNDSYRQFVDIDRQYVVWNVVAAPEFSVAPKQWCFPISGCVSYRGYFSERDARAFARDLHSQGFETYVAGVPAYSTLGWFDDPLLNTALDLDDAQLAALIFHELAHQQLYLAGDTVFNESFATAVEIEGVTRWLTRAGATHRLHTWLRERQWHRDYIDVLLNLRRQLAELYQSDLEVATKRQRKAQLYRDVLATGFADLNRRWPDMPVPAHSQGRYNNARLATVSTYYQWVGAFQSLLRRVDSDLPTFYRHAARLAGLESQQRRQQLLALDAGLENPARSDSL